MICWTTKTHIKPIWSKKKYPDFNTPIRRNGTPCDSSGATSKLNSLCNYIWNPLNVWVMYIRPPACAWGRAEEGGRGKGGRREGGKEGGNPLMYGYIRPPACAWGRAVEGGKKPQTTNCSPYISAILYTFISFSLRSRFYTKQRFCLCSIGPGRMERSYSRVGFQP